MYITAPGGGSSPEGWLSVFLLRENNKQTPFKIYLRDNIVEAECVTPQEGPSSASKLIPGSPGVFYGSGASSIPWQKTLNALGDPRDFPPIEQTSSITSRMTGGGAIKS